jgi:hypothetical protein
MYYLGGQTAQTGQTQAGSQGQVMDSGTFAYPINEKKLLISSPFGWRNHPIFGTSRFHTGIDLAYGSGTSIKASRAGKVVSAGSMGGYGNAVIIDHGDGYKTLYAHMSSITVTKGQIVSQGEEVGKVGSTGYSTGPHLHFEIQKNGNAVDPVPLLSYQPKAQATQSTIITSGKACGGRYDNIILKEAKLNNVDVLQICAIIKQESGGSSSAVSGAGARGVMQVMPETALSACRSKGINTAQDLFIPEKNIACGVAYFATQLKNFGSFDKALAAYNGGPGKAQSCIKNGALIINCLWPETQNYVRIVQANYVAYKKQNNLA